MDKRGISPIVSSVLLILLVIVGISAVFVSVREVAQETSSLPVVQQCLSLNIRADSCVIDSTEGAEKVQVRVVRGTGSGDLSMIKILFDTPGGLEVKEEDVSLDPLGAIVFSYTGEDALELLDAGEVDVLGIVDGNLCRATGSPVKCTKGFIDDPDPPVSPLGYCTDYEVYNTCDYRFAIQNAYSGFDLREFGFQNGNGLDSGTIWVAGGGATISTQTTTEEEFLSANETEIETQMRKYAKSNGLSTETTGIVMLDIEDPWRPKDIGLYNGDPGFQSEIIAAFKRRIDVGRKVFPNAKLTMYATINAPTNGYPGQNELSDEGFLEQYEGHKRAAEQGMYDSLDYLAPQVYVNWGPDDKKNVVNLGSIKAAMEYSYTLNKTTGERFTLLPGTQQIIRNNKSLNDGETIPYEMMREYIEAMQSYPYVEAVMIWHGTDNKWPCNRNDPIPCDCGHPTGTPDPFNPNNPVTPNKCYPTDVIANFEVQKVVPCGCFE